MKLDILQPWYSDGLKFACTQCGNCCTGGPGYVWISEVEIDRLAQLLKISSQEVLKKYCRKLMGRISLKELKTPEGKYDCVFLTERRGCSIYPARPLQCRTWPFWDGLLKSRAKWDSAAEGCPGMNKG